MLNIDCNYSLFKKVIHLFILNLLYQISSIMANIDLSSLYHQTIDIKIANLGYAFYKYFKKGRKRRMYMPFASKEAFITYFRKQMVIQIPEEKFERKEDEKDEKEITYGECYTINRYIDQIDGPLGSSENQEVIEIGTNVEDFYYIEYWDGGDSDVPLNRYLYINELGKIDLYVPFSTNKFIPYGRGYTAWEFPRDYAGDDMLPEHKGMDGGELLYYFFGENEEDETLMIDNPDDEIKMVFNNKIDPVEMLKFDIAWYLDIQ